MPARTWCMGVLSDVCHFLMLKDHWLPNFLLLSMVPLPLSRVHQALCAGWLVQVCCGWTSWCKVFWDVGGETWWKYRKVWSYLNCYNSFHETSEQQQTRLRISALSCSWSASHPFFFGLGKFLGSGKLVMGKNLWGHLTPSPPTGAGLFPPLDFPVLFPVLSDSSNGASITSLGSFFRRRANFSPLAKIS